MLLRFVYFLILSSLILLIGCDSNNKEALGADNEIRVICSDIDREIVHENLSQIFTDTIYTPEPEPYYFLKFSDPSTYKSMKGHANLIVAYANLNDKNPGYDLVKKILNNEQFEFISKSNPMIMGQDILAKNQLFMIINMSDENSMEKWIKGKNNFIRKKFNDQFKNRQKRHILNDFRNDELEKKLAEKYNINLQVPWGWELIKERSDSNFIWLGREMPFQWIGISWKSGKHTNDELIVGDYLWQWPKKHYGYIQNIDHKFKLDKTAFKSNNAWRLRSLWETVDVKEAKGGPMVSILFYDEKKDITVHLNYLIFHPGKNKSIYMRQMDLILRTFHLK